MSGQTTARYSVFPYASPSVALSPDASRVLLLWADDNPARSDENRTWLLWSNSDSSRPGVIDDDGTADFNPTVCFTDNEKGVAVWEDASAELPEGAEPADMAAVMEIAAAEFVAGDNPPWQSKVRLTENHYLDRSPVLAASPEGKAMVVWTANPSNNMLGSLEEPNELWYAVWDGNAWSVPQRIAEGRGPMFGGDLLYYGTNALYLFSEDTDGDVATDSDSELFLVTYNGSSWSNVARLTQDEVRDLNPHFVAAGGNPGIVWIGGEDLRFVKRLDDWMPTTVVPGAFSLAAANFTVARSPSGEHALCYAEGGIEGQQLRVLVYDPTLEDWGQIRDLTATAHVYRQVSAAYCGDRDLIIAATRTLLKNEERSIPGSDSTYTVPAPGQTDLYVMCHTIACDLAVGEDGITRSVGNPMPGETVQLSVQASNLGDTAANDVRVAFYLGDPGEGGQSIAEAVCTELLLPGATFDATVDWTVPAEGAPHTIVAIIDPDELTDDADRSNNRAERMFVAADLSVLRTNVEEVGPGLRILIVRIGNVGSMRSSATAIVFRRSDTEGEVLGQKPVPSIPAGSWTELAFHWNVGGIPPLSPDEFVHVSVDEANAIDEFDESNNEWDIRVRMDRTVDSDSDGLGDVDELLCGTDPLDPDTDDDLLLDGVETNTGIYVAPSNTGTDPKKSDTDGDGLNDGDEIVAGTDPNDPASSFRITDLSVDLSGPLTVTWNEVAGKTYTGEVSEDLVSWVLAYRRTAATTHRMTLMLDFPLSRQLFFKLRVE